MGFVKEFNLEITFMVHKNIFDVIDLKKLIWKSSLIIYILFFPL